MSLSAPIDTWSAVIDSPRLSARAGSAPAAIATAATTTPSSSDGNGWTSRMNAAARARGPSDVDELVEVLDQVVDETLASVGGVGPQSGNERMKGHGRHHLAPLGISPDHGRRTIP